MLHVITFYFVNELLVLDPSCTYIYMFGNQMICNLSPMSVVLLACPRFIVSYLTPTSQLHPSSITNIPVSLLTENVIWLSKNSPVDT